MDITPWKVIFYKEDDGSEPVKNFILKQKEEAISEIIHVFKLLRKFNVKLGMPYARKIDKSGLRELRIKHSSDYYRIFYFAYIEHKFILLHAILKKGDKTPRRDLELAIKRMNLFKDTY